MMQMNNCMLLQWHGCSGEEKSTFCWNQIFSDFLQKDYGGSETLMVEPFTEAVVSLEENFFPGAPSAARASLLWAQNYDDQD
ncbi:hypothetical protein POTOM_037851 [Populus tomentosa]|uniref:Uncharacterized protein n=1 Tax=Populus tomentosa TaxID=118781 RepID=A0A8X8CKH8_POPTO|nr:hypothetical protein POTOM_037851 [Populus tomentosa]